MDIKFLFHLLAIICTILAVVFGVTSSNNKIVLIVVFMSIAGIFELANPFLKTSPTIIPNLSFSIQSLPSNYSSGLEVDGVMWQENYSGHLFSLLNKSHDVSVADVRVYLDLPGGIVTHRVETNEGCQDLELSQFNPSGGIGTRGGEIHEVVKYLRNDLTITVARMSTRSRFTISLVIEHRGGSKAGWCEVSYKYNDGNEAKTKHIRYPIVVSSEAPLKMKLDSTTNMADQKATGHLRIMPVRPLIFKANGKVEQQKPDPNNPLEETR